LKPTVKGILVKGEPGAGKTTFAVELLRIRGRGLYISTRVSREQLFEQHPRIRTLVERGQLVEAGVEGNALQFEELGLAKPQEFIERLRSVKKLGDPVVVLDSWDAAAKALTPAERLAAEQALLQTTEQAGGQLVFLSEEPHQTTTDYLVDAIVVLKDEVLEGRRLRRIEWRKLRGSPIPQRSFPFSLAEGTFTLFQRVHVLRPGEYKAMMVRLATQAEPYYSSGSPEFDAYFGANMRPGTVTLLEIGSHVGIDWHLPLVASMRLHFLANGGFSVSIPTGTATVTTSTQMVRQHLPEDVVTNRLRIGQYEEYPPDPCFFGLEPTSIIRAYQAFWTEVERLRNATGGVGFLHLGADLIEEMHGADAVAKHTGPLVRRARHSNHVAVITARPASRSKEKLADLCDVHLRLEEVDGALVLYSEKPPSQLYNLEYDYRPGYPTIRLTPIV
jgi:KaiC/GvpD/RAD55 family RecA-like ATPase